MLFIANKYTAWYTQIITNAKARKSSGYTETHHILPKSLGGTNSSNNLVALSAREHFICHLLLIRMVSGAQKAKMVHAAWSMANRENEHQQRYTVNSHQYEKLKQVRAECLSITMSSDNPMSNPTHRQTHAEAVAKRGKTKGTTGMQHTDETKQRMRAARAKQIITEETKRKISAIRTGTTASAETKAKMAASQKGRYREKLTCIHCGKIAESPVFARWHGDKCKHKP